MSHASDTDGQHSFIASSRWLARLSSVRGRYHYWSRCGCSILGGFNGENSERDQKAVGKVLGNDEGKGEGGREGVS